MFAATTREVADSRFDLALFFGTWPKGQVAAIIMQRSRAVVELAICLRDVEQKFRRWIFLIGRSIFLDRVVETARLVGNRPFFVELERTFSPGFRRRRQHGQRQD